MENQDITQEEFQLQVLEAQYMEDLRVKNRLVSQVRTENQILRQEVDRLTRELEELTDATSEEVSED